MNRGDARASLGQSLGYSIGHISRCFRMRMTSSRSSCAWTHADRSRMKAIIFICLPLAALGALQRVHLVDLVDQPRPRPAAGFPVRGVVNDVKQWLTLQTHFFPLASGSVCVMPIIADQRFIMSGDMETNPVQKLDGVHHFEVPFLPLMQS